MNRRKPCTVNRLQRDANQLATAGSLQAHHFVLGLPYPAAAQSSSTKSMRIATETIKAALRAAVQLALIIASVIAIFEPSLRTPFLHQAIGFLFFVEVCASLYVDWKAGLLTSTPREIFERFRTTGRPRRRPLATLSMFMAFICIVVLNW